MLVQRLPFVHENSMERGVWSEWNVSGAKTYLCSQYWLFNWSSEGMLSHSNKMYTVKMTVAAKNKWVMSRVRRTPVPTPAHDAHESENAIASV